MGSFSEVVLGCYFRRDTSAEVLAAFAACADKTDARRTDVTPPLPDPVRETDPLWAPDLFYDGRSLDESESKPLATRLGVGVGLLDECGDLRLSDSAMVRGRPVAPVMSRGIRDRSIDGACLSPLADAVHRSAR